MRHIIASLFVLAIVGSAALAADAPPATRPASADVTMIAAWIAGAGDEKAFGEKFADSQWITDAKDAVFYSDVADVKVPKHLRAMPFDHVQARMQSIRSGEKVSPAVLVTRTVVDEPKDGFFGKDVQAIRKEHPGERFYYVEVAIGNMAWHWMKVRVYEADGKTRAEVVRSAVS